VDHRLAISVVCEELPDPRFNRAYVLDSERLGEEMLRELAEDFASLSLPFRVDVFLPVADEHVAFLRRAMFEVTEQFASEMVLGEGSTSLEANPAVDTMLVSPDEVDSFASVLMQAYQIPPEVVPVAAPIIHGTMSRALEGEGARFYVAHLEGRPVGVLFLYFRRGVGGIYNVGVVPEGRGQGVATTLMLRAMEDSRAAGNATLCLQCRAGSFQERFYEQLGFEIVARRHRAIREQV
jgi:GNAT superfamily N-acetyltransferase